MFLPIGDSPNPVQKPFVTWGLLAVNVAVYVLVSMPLSRSITQEDIDDPQVIEQIERMWTAHVEAGHIPENATQRVQAQWLASLSRYDVFVFQNGFKPAAPTLWTLFLSMFLHGGFMHLAGNMLFLWIYGDNVEARLGPLWYLLAYLGTGVVATYAFAVFALDSMIPLVGASGAISGVLGFYLVWYPQNRVKVLMWFYYFVDVFLVPAKWVLFAYLILDNILPVLIGGPSGVAHGAHIGGFLAGMAVAAMLKNRLPLPEMEAPAHFQRSRRYRRF